MIRNRLKIRRVNSLNQVAVFETRILNEDGERYKQRGWFDKQTGRFLGKNKFEAEDTYAINFSFRHDTVGNELITWD